MARIRTIKPEFWRSPSTAQASPWARLLYIAMWNWADDYGRAEWTPRELLGFAFPHDAESPLTDADFPSLVAEVAECFGAKFYINGGRRFYEIPAWNEHQKTEKRAQDRYPHADDPDSVPDRAFLPVEETRGFSETSLGEMGAGKGKGTGEKEQGKGNRGTAIASRGPDLDALFDSAYSHWPKKDKRTPSLQKFKQACKRRDPHDLVDDIRRFGEAYAATTQRQFIPALAAWLHQERWTDELPQRQEVEAQPRPAQVGASLIAHYSEEPAQGELTWQ